MYLLLALLLVYSTTLLAFAFAFHLLLPNHLSFESPITAFLKVLVMMIGEFDFEENFTWDNVEVEMLLFFVTKILVKRFRTAS